MQLTREEKEDCLVFGTSLLVHALMLLCLAVWFVREDINEVAVAILSSTVEEPDLDQTVSIIEISTFDETKTSLARDESFQPAPVIVDTPIPQPEVTADDLSLSSPQAEFSFEVNEMAKDLLEVASSPCASDGAASVGVANVGGAIDRLTAEIARTAAAKPTLVVWLFDASLSLSTQRGQIADRVANILAQLGGDPSLLPVTHVVCSFGKRLNVLLGEPNADADRIAKVIREIQLDESGVENIFTSVEQLARGYASNKNRRTMLVAFTDEVGDDQRECDHTLTIALHNGVAVSVVGTPAPFGIAKTQLKFVDPDQRFDQSERWVEIEQGPESLFKMTLNISSLPIDFEPMDSGFGPYALSRLCASTGGVYFALHPNRHVGARVPIKRIEPMASNIRHFFDGQLMKQYRPDYRAIAIQEKEVSSNAAKAALWNVCSRAHLDVRREFKTVFEAPNQGTFANELFEGQKKAASLLVAIDPLYATLRQGEAAAKVLTEPRWRASFFLAMGRLLAVKTRLDAYNAVLGDAKMGLKAKNKNTNRWILEPSNDLALLGFTVAKQAKAAEGYLRMVVEEFPGTPWALMAQQELEVPLTYAWVESHHAPLAVNTAGTVNAVNAPRTPQDDKKKELPKPKPQRKIDKI